jgi:hypothetical protein
LDRLAELVEQLPDIPEVAMAGQLAIGSVLAGGDAGDAKLLATGGDTGAVG